MSTTMDIGNYLLGLHSIYFHIMKHLTAFVFLLLANLVMVVHTVLPHHHHNQLVCIEDTYCNDGGLSLSHFTTGHHHHDNDWNSGDCLLRQIIVLPSGQCKQVPEIVKRSDNLSSSTFGIAAGSMYNILPPGVKAAYKDSHIPFTSFCNISPLGLRAPPVV